MSDRFPPNSRYALTDTAELTASDGRAVVYLRRRFVPDPAQFVTLQEYRIQAGDRLDRLAATVLGDPEQFWRLADSNGALDPLELEENGRILRLTLPEGMSGGGDA